MQTLALIIGYIVLVLMGAAALLIAVLVALAVYDEYKEQSTIKHTQNNGNETPRSTEPLQD